MVSIIIPTCNRDEMLRTTLLSLLQNVEGIETEILIVNDAAGRTPSLPQEAASMVLLLHNPKKGLGSARNFGVKNSKGDYLVFLDDDILITKENLLGLRKCLDEHPDKVFNAAWIYPPELLLQLRKQKFGRYLISEGFTSLRDRMKGFEWNDDKIFERAKGVSGGILAMTRQNFFKTGGFSEEMVFGGDLYFSSKIRAAGLKPFIAPNIVAYHNETDKTNLSVWLERRKFGIKQLVKHRMVERPVYSPGKERLLKFLSRYKGALKNLGEFVPNSAVFDRMYRSVINALFAVYLYEAYTEEQ